MIRAERGAAILAATLAAALALPGGAAAHAGAKLVDVTPTGYSPDYQELYPSQAVHWTWETLGSPRSVTADPNPDEPFDSGVKSSGSYEWVFRTPGTYHYRSTEGVAGMGTIVVLPYPTAPPKIKRLRVVGRSKPTARFRMNTRGDGVFQIEARSEGSWLTVRTFFKRVSKGRNRVALPARDLDRGRHRLTLRAYDPYRRLDSARDRFRI